MGGSCPMITLRVGVFFGAWCSLLAVVPLCWLQPVSHAWYLKPIQEKCYTVQNITAWALNGVFEIQSWCHMFCFSVSSWIPTPPPQLCWAKLIPTLYSQYSGWLIHLKTFFVCSFFPHEVGVKALVVLYYVKTCIKLTLSKCRWVKKERSFMYLFCLGVEVGDAQHQFCFCLDVDKYILCVPECNRIAKLLLHPGYLSSGYFTHLL